MGCDEMTELLLVPVDDNVICIGGSDGTRHYADVVRLTPEV